MSADRVKLRTVLAGAIAVAASAVTLLSPGAAVSASIVVACNGGTNLQAAIDTAAPGATLLVSGTCVGNFAIEGKTLTIAGSPVATLDGAGAGSVLRIEESTVSLDRLIVTRGSSAEGGGGIAVFESTVSLAHSIVRDNTAPLGSIGGGGILAFDSALVIGSSTVTRNTADAGFGGGIAAANSTLTISGSSLTWNQARQIANVETGSQPAGGGLYSQSATVLVTSSLISNNSAAAGGGLVNVGPPDANGGGEMTVTGSTIRDNTVTGLVISEGPGPFGGGGIVNVAVGDQGGGEAFGIDRLSSPAPAASPGEANLTIVSSTLKGNQATAAAGGAIQNIAFGDGAQANLSLSHSVLRVNAASRGGGVWSGGAEGSPATVSVADASLIQGNVAIVAGGGIDNEAESTVAISGGSLLANNHPDNCLGC
jgi:hypothetical protein